MDIAGKNLRRGQRLGGEMRRQIIHHHRHLIGRNLRAGIDHHMHDRVPVLRGVAGIGDIGQRVTGLAGIFHHRLAWPFGQDGLGGSGHGPQGGLQKPEEKFLRHGKRPFERGREKSLQKIR